MEDLALDNLNTTNRPPPLHNYHTDVGNKFKFIIELSLYLYYMKPFVTVCNLLIYQARESSLVPAGFLTAQFLQKL